MRNLFATAFSVLALAGCQTAQVVSTRGSETFEVRYNPPHVTATDADVRANRHCGGAATFVSEAAAAEGAQPSRTYRCTRRR